MASLYDLGVTEGICKEFIFVDPQTNARQLFKEKGIQTYEDVSDMERNDIALATLFHSFEHFTDPFGNLLSINEKMKKGARIIIEVPHAKDILLCYFNLDSFKEFTFWWCRTIESQLFAKASSTLERNHFLERIQIIGL